MHYYTAYGLEIRSDFPLPELSRGGEGRHVHFELARLDPPSTLERTSIWRNGIEAHFGGTGDESFLRWPGVATILAKRGELLQFDPELSGLVPEQLGLYAVSEALGMVLFQRGHFLLHASAVRVGDEAVLFVGPPGAGKSTIAAACAQLGLPVLGDDLVALTLDGPSGLVIQPGPARIKVWPQAANGLGYEPAHLTPGLLNHEKVVLRSEESQVGCSLLVRNIFFIKHAGTTGVARMSLRDAQLALLRFFPCPGAMLSGDHSRAYFLQSRRLMDHVNCWELRNSRNFKELKRFVARLGFEVTRKFGAAEDEEFRTLDRRLNARFSFVDLVAPRPVSDFFQDFFERAILHIQRNDPEYFSDVVNVDDIDGLFQEYAIPSRLLRIYKNGSEIRAPILSERGMVKTELLFKLFHEGATIVVNEGDKLIRSLNDFCDALERQLKIKLNANIYMTPPNAQGFASHYDDHDVVIMQVFGTKRWKLYHSPEFLPSQRQAHVKGKYSVKTPGYEANLKTGESLYIPRGFIHEGATSIDGSVHVTLGFHPSHWFDLVHELGRMAQDDPQFRRAVPYAIHSESDAQAFQSAFTSAMAKFFENARFHEMLTRRAETFVAGRRKHNQGRFVDVMSIASIGIDSVVSRREHVLFRRTDKGKMIQVNFEGRTIEIPRFLEESLNEILGGEQFVVHQIQGLIDNAGRIELVQKFVREGFLQIVPRADA